MKVVLPENKMNKKQIIIYVSIIIICIISIIIAFYVQFYARIDISRLLGFESKGELGTKSEEQIQTLIANFDKVFTNNIQSDNNQINFNAIDKEKPIVYTKMSKKENKLNSYNVEVYIPTINIQNEKIDEYNKEIEEFVNKTDSIIQSENKNTIYTVEYGVNIKDDILSLIVRSNLKEGTSAQRVIVQTYNYDLRNKKEITLEEVLRIEGLDKLNVQNTIKTEIQEEQNKVEDLKELGYNIYSRDIENDMYKIENSTQFYLTEDNLYIIYAYGNETFTSEMDLVII